jgi:hypothetical protein
MHQIRSRVSLWLHGRVEYWDRVVVLLMYQKNTQQAARSFGPSKPITPPREQRRRNQCSIVAPASVGAARCRVLPLARGAPDYRPRHQATLRAESSRSRLTPASEPPLARRPAPSSREVSGYGSLGRRVMAREHAPATFNFRLSPNRGPLREQCRSDR